MDNPYAAPSSNLSSRNSLGSGIGVSQRVADIMRRTMPWARVAGITTILNAVVNIVALGKGGHDLASRNAGAFLNIVINFYLAAKLLGYAKNIGRLLESGSASDLAAALAEHRRFWKVWGLYILITFIIGVIGGILMGAAAAAR